ncbi:pyridoxal-phosphate-dependent aminotransferase family protein [Enterococcus aquimarinus]|uniref:Aminotransferase, class V n=1 Tax=Enterococcus aquimarinus TaxID=328396 RepID=A0A1L8QQL8_9ENTE|nr:alanine--glyoxylate aminotransferase family protein [Enterococcus aquimarinus]OJG09767.1 aminotransferase, class V [Enterococcus aquimarinus]
MYQQPIFEGRTIMTPGPVEAHPAVLRQMVQPILGQFDPEFLKIMNEVKEMIKVPFGTKNKQAFAIDGTSRSGLEAALLALIEPGDKVLIPAYGRFAYLLGEICQRAQAEIVWLEKDWESPFEQSVVIEAIKEHQPKIVAMVHGETANAQMQPLDQIGAFCRENDVFFVVDMVATYGGIELKVDDWKVDIAIAGTQKCVSVPSGMSLITYNDRVEKYIQPRYQKELGLGSDEQSERYVRSNYLDLTQLQRYWGPERINHHTEATSMVYALHEGLRLLLLEGMENVYARHTKNDRILTESLEKMGLEIFGARETKMGTVIPVRIPEGIDGEEVRALLLDQFKIEIASSFGSLKGKIWRVGNMGYSSRQTNVLHFLSAFETVLKKVGYEFDYGVGSTYALEEYLK